jgi:hypothetical protein
MLSEELSRRASRNQRKDLGIASLMCLGESTEKRVRMHRNCRKKSCANFEVFIKFCRMKLLPVKCFGINLVTKMGWTELTVAYGRRHRVIDLRRRHGSKGCTYVHVIYLSWQIRIRWTESTVNLSAWPICMFFFEVPDDQYVLRTKHWKHKNFVNLPNLFRNKENTWILAPWCGHGNHAKH